MVTETRRRRILMVDDDLDILTVTRMALEVVGDFITDSCSSGQEALSYIEEFKPDLILVDVMMPDLDGIEFVQQLKLNPKFSQIPVIFMTARTQSDDIEDYMEAGVLSVVSKPFDPEELVRKLNSVWNIGPGPEAETETVLSQKLEQFHQVYSDQLPAKILEIQSLGSQIGKNGDDGETFLKIHRIVHNMAGAAATYGFETLSNRARTLESFLRPMIDTSRAFDPARTGELSRMIVLLGEAANKGANQGVH